MTILKRFLAAFAFLTIAPMPRGLALDADAIGRSRAFFPAPGLALGAIYAGLLAVPARFPGIPASLTVLAVVCAMCVLTRALHLDGLADLADAWGSGAPRVRALEIMRDSRIGTFGTVAIVLLLGANAAAVFEISGRVSANPGGRALRLVILAPAAARLAAAWLIQWFPYARAQGKGSLFLERKPLADLAAALALAAAAAWFLAAVPGLLCLAGAILAAHAFGMFWNRKYGGLTGDIYGAAVTLVESAALWFAALW